MNVRSKAGLGDEAGFTLFELTLASGIMLVALVLMMGSLIRISSTTAATEDRAIAATQLSTVMEEIQGFRDLDSIRTYQPPALDGLGAFQTVDVEAIAADGTAIAVPATEEAFDTNLPNPLEVRVTVTWRDASGRTFVREASTLVRRL